MHLLETYSHFCGVKPGAPYISQQYYAIAHDRYVVVQTKSGMATKDYDLWEEVCENIKLPIVQLGGKDDPIIPNAINLCGQTNWNHSAYILAHACLFIGTDSVCSHLASALGIKSVVLFGATSDLTCGPFWNREKSIVLNPADRYGCTQPCHSQQCIRPRKCINSIKPEVILCHVAQHLGADAVRKVEIPHIGDLSKIRMIEWVPVTCGQGEFEALRNVNTTIAIRADVCYPDMRCLSQLCNVINSKFMVLIDPKDVRNLSIIPDKVNEVLVMIKEGEELAAVEALKLLVKNRYRARLMSKLEHTAFESIKLDVLDYPPMIKFEDFKFTDEHRKLIGQTFSVKSGKFILGKNAKYYFTTHDALNGKNAVEIGKDNDITIEEDHLKELQFLTLRKYER